MLGEHLQNLDVPQKKWQNRKTGQVWHRSRCFSVLTFGQKVEENLPERGRAVDFWWRSATTVKPAEKVWNFRGWDLLSLIQTGWRNSAGHRPAAQVHQDLQHAEEGGVTKAAGDDDEDAWCARGGNICPSVVFSCLELQLQEQKRPSGPSQTRNDQVLLVPAPGRSLLGSSDWLKSDFNWQMVSTNQMILSVCCSEPPDGSVCVWVRTSYMETPPSLWLWNQ